MTTPEWLSFGDARELVRAAAADWLGAVARLLEAGRNPCVALSGGRIAGTLFSELRVRVEAAKLDLSRVEFFWADERCVSPDDIESNYRTAHQQLFGPLALRGHRLHRIRGEWEPESAAEAAAAELRRIAPGDAGGYPVLDLVLLGMGEDGHVASLFPDESEASVLAPAVYRAVTAPKPPPRRVTLGYGVLAAAREVWVLISGGSKASALTASLQPGCRLPLARVLRSRARTRILTDLSGNPAALV
ncbi:MAG TPA: 6-phosphogluconolactonase [Verrucomicrobiota bacterium]|nr:6-phosphogluconolactonase [Verrucomicrobiota bacterium]